MSTAPQTADQRAEALPTLAGHPTGLFMLFFAEMWERFSYYGMRALLVLYMIKGFLEYDDNTAYGVYAAYGSLVYATPFIGGAIADRLLGCRKAVILGGTLMAAGHLLMTWETSFAFFTALALLIVGNGFFKPNISTIVGTLYPEHGAASRDAGFTLFYMGINLGAAMAPLLCGYVGETYGWHYGFGLATFGMLVGLAVFVAPAGVTRMLIMLGALVTGGSMIFLNLDSSIYALGPNVLIAAALFIAAGVAFVAIGRGGLPDWAGAPPDEEKLRKPVLGPITAEWTVYIAAFAAIPLIALLVGRSELATYIVVGMGVVAEAYLFFEMARMTRIERHRMIAVHVLMVFSLLFWAFFEQGGSSINLFTDRNVDRAIEARVLTADEIGQTVDLPVSQEMAGRTNGSELYTMATVDALREDGQATVSWVVSEDDVGMGVGGDEIRTSQFQAANPTYILLFGLVFTWLWTMLSRVKLEPSTSVKFSLGILQLGLGFGALWYGAQVASPTGMVAMSWLLLGYLLHTTGELCISPVGLSMVTKLAPKRLAALIMGAWFLSFAFSSQLAGFIAMATGIEEGGGEEAVMPPPVESLPVYAEVFGIVAIAAIIAAAVLLVISPLLTKLMHLDEMDDEGAVAGHGH